MIDPLIGQIVLFAFPRAPRGWAVCDGQLLQIAQNQALFSLLGTTYGGDGRTTFGLPDLRGRVPVSFGKAPGQPAYALGQKGGEEAITLTPGQIPAHRHALQAASGRSGAPTGTPGPDVAFGPAAGAGVTPYVPAPSGVPATLAAGAVASAGGGQPHDNMMPTAVMNYCIALEGIYPPRS